MKGRKDTHTLKLESNRIYHNLRLWGAVDSETLKGSNISNTVVNGFDIYAGYEDGIDCVRGSNYVFENGIIHSTRRTRTFITLKGGIDTLTLRNIELSGKVRYPWDISLGDHTIYNKRRLMGQKNTLIDNVRRTDGRKVRVLVMDSEVPEFKDTRAVVIKIPRLLVRAWFILLN